MRGGHTRLAHITAPQADFGGPHGKTDALHAMELALSFEKLNFQKLKELQGIAEKNKDAQMSDFVEGMLQEQVGMPCFLAHVIVPRTVQNSYSAFDKCQETHLWSSMLTCAPWEVVAGFSLLDY